MISMTSPHSPNSKCTMATLRTIRAQDFQCFVEKRPPVFTAPFANIYGKRPAPEEVDGPSCKRLAHESSDHQDHPIYSDICRSRGNWKDTLRRKLTLRKSVRVKRQNSKRSLQPYLADYSLPFGNSFDYFRFSDMMNGVDEDHELHRKIDHEMKMRDGSMKMLVAAKHSLQQLEAAKALHTSNCRMLAYMEYLQGMKTSITENSGCATIAQSANSNDNLVPCKAKISLSELRIPLIWKDSDHFKNKGNYRRYTVFCLIRVGTELYETNLVTQVDRLMTDISFDDIITIDNVDHNFGCQLELYAYEHHDDLTIASTQVKLKKKINDISNTVGRRLSGITVKEPFDMQSLPGPKFELVAHSTLRLADASERSGSFDLAVNKNSELTHQLPLFGNFSCRFVVQPHCLVKESAAGFLQVKDGDEWVKYWCSLQNLKINCWNTQFEADLQDPLNMIPVTKESLVSDTDPCEAERPYAFHVQNRSMNYTWYLAAMNDESLSHWWKGFQQHLLDQVVWKQACDHIMAIHERKPQLSPYFQRDKRGGSLYEKTRVKRSSKRYQQQHLQQHLMTSDGDSASPLTMAFNRFTRHATGTTSSTSSNSSTGSSVGPPTRSSLARTNSYPK